MTKTKDQLTVQHVAIDSLRLDPNNARTHNRRNIEAIKASLVAFGQRRPLVVMADGTIIAGNGTLEAIKELEWPTVAVSFVPKDWTLDQAKAYALADNRTAELADWDSLVLSEQLLELETMGWSVGDFGFEPADFGDAGEIVQDEVPDVPEEPAITEEGELWQLGDHRLLVGDATSKQDMRRVMASAAADCVFTDPPYNVDYTGGTDEALTMMNDNLDQTAFAKFIGDAYEQMYNATKPGGSIYVCHSDTGGGVFRTKMVEAGWLLKQCLIWVKDSFVLSRQDYHWQHEPILYGWKPGAAHQWYGRRVRSTVLDEQQSIAGLKKAELVAILEEIVEVSSVVRIERPRQNLEHPTMKPVPLVARLVANSTKRNDVVLDPFGGSGSTLVAAAQMDRICLTVEKDPRYADVIIERWQNLTGEKATKEHD